MDCKMGLEMVGGVTSIDVADCGGCNSASADDSATDLEDDLCMSGWRHLLDDRGGQTLQNSFLIVLFRCLNHLGIHTDSATSEWWRPASSLLLVIEGLERRELHVL